MSSFGLTITGKKLNVQILKKFFSFRKRIAEVDLKEYFCLKSEVSINKKPGNDECGENSQKYGRKMMRRA